MDFVESSYLELKETINADMSVMVSLLFLPAKN